MDYIKNAIRDLEDAEKLLIRALKNLNRARNGQSVNLHNKLIDIRQIIEILREEE